MMKRMIVVVAFALAAMTSLAAVNWNFVSNENKTGLSGATWKRADDPSVTSTTLNGEDDYFVLSGTIYPGSNDGLIFTGHSLTVGSTSSTAKPRIFHYYTAGISGTKDMTIRNDGLKLVRGSWDVHYGSAAQPHLVYGKVTLSATADYPFEFKRYDYASENGLHFKDKFCGDGFATVAPGAKAPLFSLALLGDYSDFTGTVTLQSVTTEETPRYSVLLLANGRAAFTANVGAYCHLTPNSSSDVVTLGTVNLASGSVIDVKASAVTAGDTTTVKGSKFAVTDGFSIEADAKAKVSVAFDASAAETQVAELDVLTVPKTASLDKDAFEYVPQDSLHVFDSFDVRDDGDKQTLVVKFALPKLPILTQKEDGSNVKGLKDNVWSDGSTVADTLHDYVVNGGKYIYVSSSVDASGKDPSYNVFTGNSLTLGDITAGTSGNLYQYGGYTEGKEAVFQNDGLILARGNAITHYANLYLIKGKVQVTATSDSPFRLYSDNESTKDGHGVKICDSLSGDGYLRVCPQMNAGTFHDLVLAGDCSEFSGHLLIESGTNTKGLPAKGGLQVGNTTCTGTVDIGAGSEIGCISENDTFTMKSLCLDEGSRIKVKVSDEVSGQASLTTAGKLVATDAFSQGGKVRVAIDVKSASAVGTNPSCNYVFLTVPSTANLSADDFDLELDLSKFPSYAQPRLVVTETETTKSLALVIDGYERVDMTTKDASMDVQNDASSAFTNAWQWSDLREPHAGAHYLIGKNMNLRTPMDLSATTNFPGLSLTLQDGATFVIEYLDYTIPFLRIVNGGWIHPKYNGGGVTLHAPIEILSGTAVFRPYAGGLFTVDGTICGSGNLLINGNANGSGNPGGYTELLGHNEDFHGSVRVTMDVNPTRGFPTFETKAFSRLYVNDGSNVGGAMDPADPKGFTVENYSQLITRNSVTFDEPTRGIFIRWIGRFNVADADHVLTIRSPLAVYGTLYKEGPGTVEFANPQPTFGATATEVVPDADATNRCVVVGAGNVVISSAFALNGLNVTVTNDVPVFALDVDATDADLAAYGLVDILTPDCPFVATDAATKLHFRLGTATGAKPAWYERTVAVCTVKADQADAVAALLDVKGVRGTGIRVAAIRQVPVTVNETSCVTFVADLVANQGMLLLVR